MPVHQGKNHREHEQRRDCNPLIRRGPRGVGLSPDQQHVPPLARR
ncbi:hypothetical protein L842_5950 [Mycobacterium intracellulare MIN_052511_1280]|nr:hypothetical protein L842_5950 [Mycobacterium intracellulare MIN_052511_1280]